MNLGAKQELFTITMARFEVWVYDCTPYRIRSGEFHRPPETAELYAAQQRGIKNSNHTKKLAKDVFLSKPDDEGNYTVTWEFDDYEFVARHWLTLHKLCRWGGDIPRFRDAVHFSFIHNGVI